MEVLGIAANLIRDASYLLVVAGAGLNQESGIPSTVSIQHFLIYLALVEVDNNPIYQSANMGFFDFCDFNKNPYVNPELFYGFWGQFFNCAKTSPPNCAYKIISTWRNKLFHSSNFFFYTSNFDSLVNCYFHEDEGIPALFLILLTLASLRNPWQHRKLGMHHPMWYPKLETASQFHISRSSQPQFPSSFTHKFQVHPSTLCVSADPTFGKRKQMDSSHPKCPNCRRLCVPSVLTRCPNHIGFQESLTNYQNWKTSVLEDLKVRPLPVLRGPFSPSCRPIPTNVWWSSK